MDKSAELVGKRGLAPEFLVDWIADKRGELCHMSSEEVIMYVNVSKYYRKALLHLHEV